jgi:hypothetical protein
LISAPILVVAYLVNKINVGLQKRANTPLLQNITPLWIGFVPHVLVKDDNSTYVLIRICTSNTIQKDRRIFRFELDIQGRILRNRCKSWLTCNRKLLEPVPNKKNMQNPNQSNGCFKKVRSDVSMRPRM